MESRHILCAGFVCVVLARCGGVGADEASSTITTKTLPSTTTFVPLTTTTVPSTTTTLAPTTTTVSAERLAKAEQMGDVAAGEELFFTGLDGIPHDFPCATCHSLDGTEIPGGPSLQGISDVAGDRIEGLSDIEYLRQSLTDPNAFRADDDSTDSMPYQYADVLTEQQVSNLVAFLLTK